MPVNAETPIGTRVKSSGDALRPTRDWWLGCGRASSKSAAKAELDRKTARRGTLIAIEQGKYALGFRVAWDDGGESCGLSYMIVTA